MRNRIVILLACLLGMVWTATAQADPIEGYWLNESGNAKIHIYKARNGKYCGKVAWLRVPNYQGKPKTDMKNPDPAKRTRPVIGMIILTGLIKEGKNGYDDGEIYDPENGKFYSCKATLKGNTLELRGYMGVSFIGRTTVWKRAD